MRQLIVLIVLVFSSQLKAQNHVAGAGAGFISVYEFSTYISYQFSYKWLNSKTKLSFVPFTRYGSSWSLINDYYIGIKTTENKKNILSFNIGASILYPKKGKYISDIEQQINPIVNLSYSYCFNDHHRITTDLSLTQYIIILGRNRVYNPIELLIFEIGYAYKFKNNSKKNNHETQ